MTDRRSGWRIVIGLVLIALAWMQTPASAGAVGPTVASPGGIGIRLLEAPTESGEDPRARLYIIDHLAPGAGLTRRIEVTNTTRAPLSVSLYAAGATIDSGHFVGASGHTANDLSSWTTVFPGSVELRPGGSATVDVTILVPLDAEPGERYAAVWAEVRSGIENGILQVNRVGIRSYVSVGPGAGPAADFTIDSLAARRSSEGLPTVVATVRNTGGRALDMSGSLELLNGPSGLRAGPYPATLGSTLAVGATGQVMIELDERVPDGPWNAELTLRSGLLARSARATITFPKSGSAPPVVATATGAGWLWAAGAGLVLLLACAFVVIVAIRRRRSRRTDTPC